MSGLAGARNGLKAPSAATGVGIVRIHKSANSVFAAGNANDHLVLHHQRSDGEGIGGVGIGGLYVP